jgi:hypothetical protein
MKTADKMQWILVQRCRAYDAISTLANAKKKIGGEYDERLRKCKDYAESLRIKQSDPEQMEMFDFASLLSPEIDRLLDAPTHGLD